MTQTETRSPHFGRAATANTYRDIHLPRVFAPWARILLEILPPRSGEAVLDVATGPGTVARQAAALVGASGRVTGVDISAAMLEVGRAWAPEDGSAPITYIESTATAIDLPDASFDVAYCQQGLQHMSEPGAALQQILRLLRPGGRLGVAIWKESPFGVFRQVVAEMGLNGEGAQPSAFGRDAGQLGAVLTDAGFTEVKVQTRDFESVLEGGVPQALEVAMATSASAGMADLGEEQQARVRAAIARALQPMDKADGVHLKSVSHIATAVRP